MRGSRRCGAVPVRAVVWRPASRPRLSGGMLGLGSRARNWSWGWGAWLPRLLFSRKAPPHPPSLLIWGWVTLPASLPAGEASPSAPGSALCCSRSRGRSGNPAGFSELPGRGASERATPGRSSAGGLVFPQPSVLRAAPGVHTCPRAGKVESGSSSSCCPRPASGRGSLLVAEVLISGFSGSGRPELEFRTPYSRHFFKSFLCQFFFFFCPLNTLLGDRLDKIFHFPVF